MKLLWLKLKAKPWFATALVVVGAVLSALLFSRLGGKKPGPPPEKQSFKDKARAEAEAASKELEVRAKMTRERTEEQVAKVDEALAEKDPAKRRDQLASILTSWGS